MEADHVDLSEEYREMLRALDLADALAAKVMVLRADQNNWPKEQEVYEAMVAYRAVRAPKEEAP